MHKVTITNGKYPHKYQASVYRRINIWRVAFWWLLYRRRGPKTHINYVAINWAAEFKCEIINQIEI